VAVVGAAATGCQLASIFSAFGAKVWLLEAAPRILAVEDVQVSQAVTEAFQAHGIEPVTGIGGVECVEAAASNGTLRVRYRRNDRSEDLSVEAVMFAVGWVGNLEELDIPAANVKTELSYVAVDDRFQTSEPTVYAAGDITGRMMLVQSAQIEGRLVAENALLDRGQSYTHRIVPHGGFTDPEYAGVGLTEEQARAAEGDCAMGVVPYEALDRAVIDGHTEGFCKLIAFRRTGHIMGAHVVGEQAVEIVQLAAAGMATGMRVQQLADLELAYPTYTDVIGMAAREATR
jgi:pyruvate/2-oxoglutarate dehydrogenase complex dihydrolipoamide dehydrogenase (E3) component